MPMFDPVKDAIENSPVAKTQPLPPTPSFKHDLLAPSPSPTVAHAPHVEPPSPGHRSGSLHMLLNAANDAPRPLKRQRTSSLAHLLSPTDAPDLQLDAVTDPASSPLRAYPRRPSDPNASMPPPALPVSRPPSLPYKPRRISQPLRCHLPLTPEERASLDSSCRNRLRTGPPRSRPSSSNGPAGKAAPLLSPSPGSRPGSSSGPHLDARVSPDVQMRGPQDGSARHDSAESRKRRHQSDEPDDRPQRTANGRGDSHVVAQHYNQRKEVGRQARQTSVIIGLRSFNNWIKSVLIAKFCRRPFHESATHSDAGRTRAMSGKVLDLGCGKGGDLNKWSKAGVKEYVGLDIADVSISQAENRYREMAPFQRFDAEFHAFDCFSGPIDSVVSPQRLLTPFDVVSMQFCMHYAFESLQKVRTMLKNVSDYLRPGGIFLGTIPNSDLLLSKLAQLPGDELSFGNPVYQIRFDSKDEQPLYGHRYWFYLRDAVENVPEYVVRWEEFKALSLEYGLKAVYRSEFHEIFADERRDSEFGPLLQRMKVVNARGDSAMTEDQWDAANIYIGFAFEKQ